MTPPVTITAEKKKALREKWRKDHAERLEIAANHKPPTPCHRRPVRQAPTLQVTGTTPEQQARWKDAASRQGMTLAAWMRAACEAFASNST